jgi:YihY family inner membrane protein
MNLVRRALRAIDRWQQRHASLGLPFAVVKKFGDDQAGSHAALLAYYGFFSLFPLLLLLVTALGFVLRSHPGLEQRIVSSALAQFPVVGGQIKVHEIRGSGVALVVGIVGTLWAGLGVTQEAQNAMNAVWNVPRKARPSFQVRLLRGLGLLTVLGGAIVVSTLLSGLGTLHGASLAGRALSLVGSLLVNVALFFLAYQALTVASPGRRSLLPGSAVGAVGWTALQALGTYYVSHQLRGAGQVYGTFAFVIGLLSWLYLGAQLVLFCAELNVVVARRLWPRSLLAPPLTEQDKRVLTDLAMAEERRHEEQVDVGFQPPGDEQAGDEQADPASR